MRRIYSFILVAVLFYSESSATSLYVISSPNNVPTELKSQNLYYSIQSAVKKAKKGDIIYICEGEYFENIIIKDKQNLTITCYKNHQVLINGSDRIYSKSFVSSKRRFSTDKTELETHFLENSSKYKYPMSYDHNDNLLWVYNSRKKLENRAISTKTIEGVAIENNLLLTDKKFKNNKLNFIEISRPNHVFSVVNCEDVTIDGKNEQLTIKNGSRRNVLISGEKVDKNSEIVIRSCKIINAKIGVTIANTGNKIILESNKVYANIDTLLTWNEIKNCHVFNPDVKNCIAYLQTNGILVSGTTKDVLIKGNDVFGHFNGVVIYANNVVVEKNQIHDIKDDAIEVEKKASEIVIKDNFIFNSFRSLSFAPVVNGPVYVYNNIISQSQRSYRNARDKKTGKAIYAPSKTMKFWSQPRSGKVSITRNIHIYNNSFYSSNEVFNIGSEKKMMSPQNVTICNNLFITKGKLSNDFQLHNSNTIANNLFVKISKKKDIKEGIKKIKIRSFANNYLIETNDPGNFDPLDKTSFDLSQKTKEEIENLKTIDLKGHYPEIKNTLGNY